jgi:beta-N-acetylhexosaminidase
MNAAIFGCAGPRLTEEERVFFRKADPVGFILFARNCETPAQVRALVDSLRETVGRADAPILIDQEGGRVQRLKPPHWPQRPPAARFGERARRDRKAGFAAARLCGRLIAGDLEPLGITVDCAPVLDVHRPETHEVIGDRAFSDDPGLVAALAGAYAAGLAEGGVITVIKHVPGHGRAAADSHLELPVVTASRKELEELDFAPFRALATLPWAMTAHVLYTALDDKRPATTSPPIIKDIIRGWMGFDGLLLSDDLSMQALHGSFGERTHASLAAGCDVVLHCNGQMAEMREIAEAAHTITAAGARRLERSLHARRKPQAHDAKQLDAEMKTLLA